MQKEPETRKFALNVEEVKKLNLVLPSGYKFVINDESKKKAQSKPKRRTVMGLPLSSEVINQVSTNLDKTAKVDQSSRVKIPPTKDNIYAEDPPEAYEKIPLKVDLLRANSENPHDQLSTVSVFSKLKNHPQIQILYEIEPTEAYCLSFRQIQQKVSAQRQNYPVQEMITDVSKICLKIYESYPRDSEKYQETSSIEKYLKSLTYVQKAVPQSQKVQQNRYQSGNTAPLSLVSKNSMTSVTSGVIPLKKRPSTRPNEMSQVITIKEKRQLGQRIKKLPSEGLQQVCLILFENLENKEYSFDLDTLHVKKIRQLQDYVNSCGDLLSKDSFEDENRANDEDSGDESTFMIETDNAV